MHKIHFEIIVNLVDKLLGRLHTGIELVSGAQNYYTTCHYKLYYTITTPVSKQVNKKPSCR